MKFTASYRQRETAQPQTFSYMNPGPKWTFNWLSYIEDDPTNPAAPASLYQRGGGKDTSTGYAGGSYAPTTRTQALITRTSASPALSRVMRPGASILRRSGGEALRAIVDLSRRLSTKTVIRLDYDVASGCPTFVAVMEPANFWDSRDNAVVVNRTWNRCVLRERQMGSRSFVRRHRVPRACITELFRGPPRGWVSSDREVHDTSAIAGEEHEQEQQALRSPGRGSRRTRIGSAPMPRALAASSAAIKRRRAAEGGCAAPLFCCQTA